MGGMKKRVWQEEVIDDPGLPESVWNRVHRDLDRMHRVLGNYRAVFSTLGEESGSVMDIGCGNGALLRRLRARRRVARAVGVDLRPPQQGTDGIAYVAADATRDLLPQVDTAVSLCLMHHLREDEVVALLRNSRRSAGRLIVLDLVRDPLPLWLFRKFVTPFVHPVTAADGEVSLRRAWTVAELREMVLRAIAGTGAQWQHRVAPLRVRQVVDIRWR